MTRSLELAARECLSEPCAAMLTPGGIEEIQDGLKRKRFTSVDLVKAYLARIDEGPRSLHGIPILLKDNIATLHSEGMNTTAGSYALLGSVVAGESFVAAQLRAAGAILLGKCTLSEWANWRGTVPSGFCGRGGHGTNPYVPLGNPSGSSSGSGIAGAVGLATATLGSETDGSIISPSGNCNVVASSRRWGLLRAQGYVVLLWLRLIPISEHQDSVGLMCRSVADCAIVLSTIAGRDPHDSYTLNQPAQVPDYTKALKKDGLRGVRLGVPRKVLEGVDANVLIAFNKALKDLTELGATVVDPADFGDGWDYEEVQNREDVVLCGDFKVNIHSYLSKLVDVPTGVRTLADLIKFNEDNREKELVEPYWTDQARFVKSNGVHQDPAFWEALEWDYRMGRQDGVDGLLKKYGVDAILIPTARASRPAAVAGYPVITAPDVALTEASPTRMNGPNMPFGISFLGTAYSEFQLIQYAYAYEQATKHRLEKKAYPEAIPKTQLADVMGK
ncbi:amidase signature enzyme [Fomitopsis serialis]|uniref:amidase signature enzyme n=1 Tax=Fomitopsis serialis TaxID=139415 RepID=UPI0020083DAC|nr:amidase signature enzyme [Neoantrodia serialis]KAH9912595.1 amidase signature enzyme [Neoantrodia serialis]